MTRRDFITTAAVGAQMAGASAEEVSRPNIVLIMADDLGYSDIGCYGGEIPTPNIDLLAKTGMRFTQFYNCAICSPTRVALMSGLHPRPGWKLSNRMLTLAQLLRNAGYRTSISGKWNVQGQEPKSPLAWGFTEFYGVMDTPSNYFDPSRIDLKKGVYRGFIGEAGGFPPNYYLTDGITDHATRMIRRFSEGSDPFFVYVPHAAPHHPLQARPQDIRRYAGKYMDGWDALRYRRYRRLVKEGLCEPEWPLPSRDPQVHAWSSESHKAWQDSRMAVYAAMIESLDQGVGRIMRTLKETGRDKNTLVLFLSDNGASDSEMAWDKPEIMPGAIDTYCLGGPGWAHLSNTPFKGFKEGLHEGGIATPLIAWWPGKIQPNTITEQVGHVIDFVPTFAEVAGARQSLTRQGQLSPEGISLMPVLQGKTQAKDRRLFWDTFKLGGRAIRDGRWKLVCTNARESWELYDLAVDRAETRNLAREQPQRVRELSLAFAQWRAGLSYEG